MKKWIGLACGLFLAGTSGASVSQSLNICTPDFTVCNWPYKLLVTPDSALVDNANGTMTLTVSGSGGSTITLSSFTATQPILYNNATGAFSATLISLSTGVTSSLPAANIAAGSLGAGVIASSNAVNSVYPASLQSGSYTNITGVGTLSAGTWSATRLLSSVIPTDVAYVDAANTFTSSQTINAAVLHGGKVSFTNTSLYGIVGSTTSDSAATGNVGERVTSVAAQTNLPATGTYGDLTSISLTAGDWDVTIVWDCALNGAVISGSLGVGISTTTGNSATGLVAGDNQIYIVAPGTTYDSSGSLANWQLSASGTTTVYYKYKGAYTGGPPILGGRLSARRMR